MIKEQELIVVEELNQLIDKSRDLREEEFYTIFTIHEVQNIETVLNMLKEKDAKIEHLEEKRNNQKAELAILNEKQKEMNKLTNTVSSYKGMFKRQQKDQEKKDKIIDLMAEEIKERKYVFTNKTKKEIKQYFERKSEE